MTGQRDGDSGAEDLLSLTVREADGALILTAVGEIDILTARRLLVAVNECLDRADGVLVVDLVNVSFMSSHGLAALVEATQASRNSRFKAPMRLAVDENRPVVRPIQITGLDQYLSLYHSVEDALAV